MSSVPGTTYGNLQMEERYKKLERTLKLLLHQQNQKMPPPTNLEPPWPSVSSINGENLDTSCTGLSLHSSRIGSEVVASSRDMRQMIHPRSKLPVLQKMTTSSVKQFPTSLNQEERVLMPPPRTIGILAHSSRRNSLAGSVNSKSCPRIPSAGTETGYSAAQSVISSIKCSSSMKDTSRVEFEKENFRGFDKEPDNKPDRIFTKWRPVLNDKGQLIIKGTLECGKIARSKPVIQRLSSTSVQSIFKHIYHLNGNIHDERNELPSYIRGKFFNGFPDDWENVYQVWSNYVAGGCRDNFRWPTPVTDSDDDLQSELTDFSVVKPRKRRNSDRKNGSERHLSPRKRAIIDDSKNPHEISQIKDKNGKITENSFSSHKLPENLDKNKNCCCTREENNDTIQNFMEKIRNQQMNASTSSSTSSSIDRFSFTSLKEIIHEDKLAIILDNLTRRKCSIEYIDKIIEMFDCMKYVVSYKSEDTENHSPVRNEELASNKKDTPHPFSLGVNSKKLGNSSRSVEANHTGKHVRRKLSRNDYASSDGDDDSDDARKYPRYPRRESSRKPRRSLEKRRKYGAGVSESDDDAKAEKPSYFPNSITKLPQKPAKPVNYDSSVSLTEDERRPPKLPIYHQPRDKTPLRTPQKHQNHYDSSVSITEDEFGEKTPRRVDLNKQIQVNPKITRTPSEIKRNQRDFGTQDDRVDPPSIIIDNQKMADFLPSDNQKNSHEKIDEDPGNSSSEKRQKKPTIVEVEKVSVCIPPVKISSPKDPPELIPQKSVSSCSSGAPTAPAPENKDKNPRVELQDVLKEKEAKGSFGSEANPKILTSWCPKLLKKSGDTFSLVFEGKLLNEAGHIASRKFTTASVLRRINPRIVETEDHEFYQLSGDLCDTKHKLPKEVQRSCLKGCPGKINYFCEKWRKLVEVDALDKTAAGNATMDMMGVPMSSRGRRIVPPLCYWTGERVTLKDNMPVYSPGTSQETSMPSSLEMSFRNDTSQNSTRRRDTSAKDTSTSFVNASKKDKAEKTRSPEKKAEKIEKKAPENLERKTRSKSLKRRLTRQVKDDSSDSEADDNQIKRRRRRRKSEKSPAKVSEKEEKDNKNKLRAQGRLRTRDGKSDVMKVQTSGLTCTYHKNVPYRDDVLSDDQSSLLL